MSNDNTGFNLSNILILSSLRTGDPILDSLLVIFFTSFFGYFTAHREKLFNVFSRKRQKVYVDKTDERRWNSYRNCTFTAVQWYLSSLKQKARELEAVQLYKDDPLLMSIAKNSTHSFMYEGQKINVEYIFTQQRGDKSMITIKEALLLTYDGKIMNFLPGFIEYVTKAHTEFLENARWKQKLWNLERSEKSLEWESYETGNHKTFSNIIMSKSRKVALENDVKSFLKGEELYKKRGVSWCRGYLFHGEPGCGKTSLIKAIANEAKMDIYCMDISVFNNDQELRTMFRKIPAKSVVVFEDIDASSDIVKKRDDKKEEDEDSIDLATGVVKLSTNKKKITFSACSLL